jgi:gamma-tubulin complex component 2
LLLQSAGDSSADAYASLSSQGLKGVEAFTLDYKVGWPNSIVLSRRAITKYQLLSRLLYFSKHVERRVLASWMGHQSTKVRQPPFLA